MNINLLIAEQARAERERADAQARDDMRPRMTVEDYADQQRQHERDADLLADACNGLSMI